MSRKFMENKTTLNIQSEIFDVIIGQLWNGKVFAL